MSELPPSVKKSLAQEFFDFLKVFGIIGLAIAFVIGQAASKLVTAFVNDIITPFIGLFLPSGDLSKMAAMIGKSNFMWGDLIANIIDFLIIAFIVFLAYKQLSRFKLVEDKSKPTESK
ncbi:MAG TPA: MscL family protein [Candidatus Nitrosopolaris sp.]|nr:MscL family protein [Candidatus Nitrosopolaris sp.]